MAIVTREDFYFEPRVINSYGKIRWYGEEYSNTETEKHTEYTVYIRDNGKELYVYELYDDNDYDEGKNKIVCTFNLITKITKNSDSLFMAE